jgi:uncharacterized protein (TIGR04255 family)
MLNPSPEFDRPPLDEMAIGVQFVPLPNFHVAHLGLFWSSIREKYPFTEDQVPIVPQFENVENTPTIPNTVQVLLDPQMGPRCLFLDGSKNQLVQLQRDRFIRNWRQLTGTEAYPRFTSLLAEFQKEWEAFLAFSQRESLGQPVINQCELTYTNKMEPGAVWKDYSESAKVFTLLRDSPGGGFLPPLEMVAFEARYKLPDGRGRLRVQVQPAFRARDLKLILTFNLIVRGAPVDGSPEQVSAWFALAHEWIVKAFSELTTKQMHVAWGKQ